MKWKPWCITGLCCLGVGLLCTGIAVSAGALDQERLAELLNLTDRTDTVTESFSAVLVDVDDADVIVQSGDAVEIQAEQIHPDEYTVSVAGDTLQITLQTDSKNHWDRWLSFGKTSHATITITLPETYAQTVAIAAQVGDCCVQGLQISTLSVDIDTGDCTIDAVDAASVTMDCDTADCALTDCTVSGTLAVTMDCGDFAITRTTVGKLCRMQSQLGDIRATDVTCGSSDVLLSCGDLTLEQYVETDSAQASTFLLDLGDLALDQSVLYGANLTLNYGDLTASDTALYAGTTIVSDLGDITLQLRGASSTYEVLETASSVEAAQSDTNRIVITSDETARVTYTQ